jgi:hypothetical protein
MRGERCPTYNAIQNNKFVVNKIVIKQNNLCSLSLWGSFLLLCRFRTFVKILRTVVTSTIDAGFGERCAVLMQPLFTEWAFYPVEFFFCYIVDFLHSLQQSLSSFLSELLVFGFWTIFLKLFFICLAFSFFFWMIGELARTSMETSRYPWWPSVW